MFSILVKLDLILEDQTNFTCYRALIREVDIQWDPCEKHVPLGVEKAEEQTLSQSLNT